MTLSISLLLPISGLIGVLRSPVFPLWLSGGTLSKGKSIIKGLISIIKGLTIRYCCVRSSQRSENRGLLCRLADHLECRVDAGFISCLGPYRSTLAEIARLDIEVAHGAQVRAPARWVEEGETSSAFFPRLEKKRAADWSVAALRTNDGSIVSHNDDLCRVFSSFYESLFTAEATDPAIANSLLSNDSCTLPSTQADL